MHSNTPSSRNSSEWKYNFQSRRRRATKIPTSPNTLIKIRISRSIVGWITFRIGLSSNSWTSKWIKTSLLPLNPQNLIVTNASKPYFLSKVEESLVMINVKATLNCLKMLLSFRPKSTSSRKTTVSCREVKGHNKKVMVDLISAVKALLKIILSMIKPK